MTTQRFDDYLLERDIEVEGRLREDRAYIAAHRTAIIQLCDVINALSAALGELREAVGKETLHAERVRRELDALKVAAVASVEELKRMNDAGVVTSVQSTVRNANGFIEAVVTKTMPS